jgi:phosphoglycolate phosphatase
MISQKKKAAVIFDCDGVMFDSRKANINYYNHLLASFGLPPMTEKKIDFVHSYTADESIGHIFKGTPYLSQALALREKIDYTPFIRDMVIEPGLKELLKDLKPAFGLAVATNRGGTIRKVLEYNDLNGFFDIVVSSLDVKYPKPHPESLLRILDFFNLTPQDVFYIGDSQIDNESARAAGVIFVAYKSPKLDADHHVSSMMEIKDVLKVRKGIDE